MTEMFHDLEALLSAVYENSQLRHSSDHGEGHWLAVAATGLAIYERSVEVEASLLPDPELAVLFGLVHDARRINEFHDPEHGPRAAELVLDLLERELIILTDQQLEDLCEACQLHDTGAVNPLNARIGACYDADRLQLARFGIEVRHDLLSTQAGQELDLDGLCADYDGRSHEFSWSDLFTRAYDLKAAQVMQEIRNDEKLWQAVEASLKSTPQQREHVAEALRECRTQHGTSSLLD